MARAIDRFGLPGVMVCLPPLYSYDGRRRAGDLYRIEWKVPLYYFDHNGFLQLLPVVERMMGDLFATPYGSPRIYPDLALRIQHAVRSMIEYWGLGEEFVGQKLEFEVVPRMKPWWEHR